MSDVEIYRILQYPEDIHWLRRKAVQVPREAIKTPKLQKLIANMIATYHAQTNCAALAATQLEMTLEESPQNDPPDAPAITIIGLDPENLRCVINPKIISRSENSYAADEGCMSVGVSCDRPYFAISRSKEITVEYFNEHGAQIQETVKDYLARCFQHEMEHLDGKLYIDKLSSSKRVKLQKIMKK